MDIAALVALTSWAELNKTIRFLTENQLNTMINCELIGAKRPDILKRLHQRMSKLRNERERKEMGL